MKKRILHLTLYKKYFDQIANGTKLNEYRTASAYWIKRLEGKTFDEIHFKNGYSKDAPFMRVEFKEIVRQNIAALGGDTFVIALGKVLELRNYTNQ